MVVRRFAFVSTEKALWGMVFSGEGDGSLGKEAVRNWGRGLRLPKYYRYLLLSC